MAASQVCSSCTDPFLMPPLQLERKELHYLRKTSLAELKYFLFINQHLPFSGLGGTLPMTRCTSWNEKEPLIWCCLGFVILAYCRQFAQLQHTVCVYIYMGELYNLQYIQMPGIHTVIFTWCITWTHSLAATTRLPPLSNTSDKGE